MDDAVTRFREAADQENRRRPLRRRYSRELQEQAVAYWRQRRSDEGVRAIAASLGISVTSLQRWTRAAARPPRFRPIAVPAPAAAGETVVIRIGPEGPRVEGLTIEVAARLLALLR